MFSVREHMSKAHCSRGYRGDTIKGFFWKRSLIMKATWYKVPPTLLPARVLLFYVPASRQMVSVSIMRMRKRAPKGPTVTLRC